VAVVLLVFQLVCGRAAVFKELSFITEAFAEELVCAGKWDYAVYVLQYHPNADDQIKSVIRRNAHINSTIDCTSLRKVPEFWFQEALAIYEKHLFRFDCAFDRYIKCDKHFIASELAIHEIAPEYIIKYTDKQLYTKLYEEVLMRLEESSKEISSVILEEEIYITYLKLSQKMRNMKRFEVEEDIIEVLATIEYLEQKIFCLARVGIKQKVALSVMKSNLIQWKLRTVDEKNKRTGVDQFENVIESEICQNESVIRFTENLAWKYLKAVSPNMG
jgi:hypothetical protein